MKAQAVPQAADWCGERLRGPGEDLYLATLFSPPDARDCVRAVAALYVELEAIAGDFRDINVARTKLAWWRQELARLETDGATHPATRLIVAGTDRPPVTALLDLVGGFELALLAGPAGDLATAELHAERGGARLAVVFDELHRPAAETAPSARPAGEAAGLVRVLDRQGLAPGAKEEIAAAARRRLAQVAPGLRLLAPPLRVLAALAWRRATERGVGGERSRARVFTAWRAARGRFPRALRRAGRGA